MNKPVYKTTRNQGTPELFECTICEWRGTEKEKEQIPAPEICHGAMKCVCPECYNEDFYGILKA